MSATWELRQAGSVLATLAIVQAPSLRGKADLSTVYSQGPREVLVIGDKHHAPAPLTLSGYIRAEDAFTALTMLKDLKAALQDADEIRFVPPAGGGDELFRLGRGRGIEPDLSLLAVGYISYKLHWLPTSPTWVTSGGVEVILP